MAIWGPHVWSWGAVVAVVELKCPSSVMRGREAAIVRCEFVRCESA